MKNKLCNKRGLRFVFKFFCAMATLCLITCVFSSMRDTSYSQAPGGQVHKVVIAGENNAETDVPGASDPKDVKPDEKYPADDGLTQEERERYEKERKRLIEIERERIEKKIIEAERLEMQRLKKEAERLKKLEAIKRKKEAAEKKRLAERIIIESKRNVHLERFMNGVVRSTGLTDLSVYAKSLKTGDVYTYNSNVKRYPASMVKFIMSYGVLSTGNSVSKYYKEPVTNQTFKLGDVVRRAVTYSDNLKYNYLVRMFGVKDVDRWLEEQGYSNTKYLVELIGADKYSTFKGNAARYGRIGGTYTTTSDLGLMYERFYKDYKRNKPGMKLLYSALVSNVYNDRIPTGIGFRSPVAHKTGWVPGNMCDSGIVLKRGHPFILVIMIREPDNSKAYYAMHTISRGAYNYFK